jgi:uncharacterized protein YndB with AHSA1/START domain
VTPERISALSKHERFPALQAWAALASPWAPVVVRALTNLSFDIYLRATPQQVHAVLTEPAMLPSWLAGMQLQPDGEEDPRRLTCEWLQTEHLEINGGTSSVVRFDLVALGQVTRLTVNHRGLEPGGSLLKVIGPGWPMILSSVKTLMETGAPLEFRGNT